MIVACTHEIDDIVRVHSNRVRLSVDIGAVNNADQLYRAFVQQLPTRPEMDPMGSMVWDALVDGIGNGLETAASPEQGVVLTIGPADVLRQGELSTLDELMAWLEQLEERVQRPGAPAPWLISVLHGQHVSFERGRH